MKRKIIEINDELCDGCGQCVPSCAEGALEIIEGKARLAEEKYCDGLGACLGECPTGALKIVEREAEDFDEEAVSAYLREKKEKEEPTLSPQAFACPSSQVRTFVREAPVGGEQRTPREGPSTSALSHWPVQIHLVPPTAPFLKGADLLVVSDCVPVAYPSLHGDFLPGKVVMMGCPKFDDVKGYIEKFTQIFKGAGIKSVTTLSMEVPCCSGLPMIVRRALDAAGRDIPMEQIVIGTRGDILNREKRVA